MSGVSVTRNAFQMTVPVPDDLVELPADGESSADQDGDWAAWTGVTGGPVEGRSAVILISVTVTAYTPPPGASGAEALAARLRAQYPDEGQCLEAGQRPETGQRAARARGQRSARGPRPGGSARIEQFTASGGSPAVSVRRVVTKRAGGRTVATGQAQALVVFPGPGALGVVSGICLDPADLERAAALVTEMAAGMTVTGASAAA